MGEGVELQAVLPQSYRNHDYGFPAAASDLSVPRCLHGLPEHDALTNMIAMFRALIYPRRVAQNFFWEKPASIQRDTSAAHLLTEIPCSTRTAYPKPIRMVRRHTRGFCPMNPVPPRSGFLAEP
jgi:hypothetical protein